MAVTGKLRILDLIPEFLADAFVLLAPLQAAGTITAGAFQAVFDHLYDFFVLIQSNRHVQSPFSFYYTAGVKGTVSSFLLIKSVL